MKDYLATLPSKVLFAVIYFGFIFSRPGYEILRVKNVLTVLFVLFVIFFSDIIGRRIAGKIRDRNSNKSMDSD